MKVDWLKPINGIDWTILDGKAVFINVNKRSDGKNIDLFLTEIEGQIRTPIIKRTILAQTFELNSLSNSAGSNTKEK